MSAPKDAPLAGGRWYERAKLPLPSLGDPEGDRLPALPEVIDAHVHLFPDPLFEAMRKWFGENAWPIRYRLSSERAIEFLLSRGVSHLVGLCYAHRPGVARALNAHMAGLCRNQPQITGLATVLPGEEGAGEILREAFAMGLRGVKLHCHVQCLSPDAPEMHEVYGACEEAGLPLVIHAGREPALPRYRCDPYQLCSADRIERVLGDHPRLRVCVPHFGADEFSEYGRLLERHDNLYLDTTMTASGYFPVETPGWLFRLRPERVLYGSDFPNLPFAWDRELRAIAGLGLDDQALARILGGTARELFRPSTLD
ncbi:MAG: amidohydrolase [Myxococcales bacterium]|nr:amidohydrolase [Myxococcales bacterium]